MNPYLELPKNEEVLISVVMPVYNSADYIKKAMDSILIQSLHRIELVIVNDGSTDSSGQIADSYANVDPRVRVFHKKNGGVSSARNFGIGHAAGKYVSFIDPDDYLDDPYTLENLYNKAVATNSDVVIFGFTIVDMKNNVTYARLCNHPPNVVLDKKEILKDLIKGDSNASACNKIYSLDLIKKHNIRFDESLSLGEDYIFNMTVFTHASAAVHTPENRYHYVTGHGISATTKYFEDYHNMHERIFLFKYRHLTLWGLDSKIWLPYMADHYVYVTIKAIINQFSAKSGRSLLQKVSSVREILHKPSVREALASLPGQSLYSRSFSFDLYRYVKSKNVFVMCCFGYYYNSGIFTAVREAKKKLRRFLTYSARPM